MSRSDAYLRERAEIAAPDECWPWKLSVGSHGYGNAFDGKVVCLAHRLAYEVWVGPIPSDLTVDHICHVRRCINPAHLRLLTNVENATDNRRERTPIDHERVRELHDQGYRQAAIARLMGISCHLVRRSYVDQGLRAAPCGMPRKGTITDLVAAG